MAAFMPFDIEMANIAGHYEVLLFASLKDAAGTDRIVLRIDDIDPAQVKVADLLEACSIQFPMLAPWLPYIKVAVDRVYAGLQSPAPIGVEIAFLPPVAGGA